jgi:TonB family protein
VQAGPRLAPKLLDAEQNPARTFEVEMFRRAWLWIVVIAVPASGSAQPSSPTLPHAISAPREQQLWRTPDRSSEFADIPGISATSRCEDTQPPEALTTPDPLVMQSMIGGEVKVSFIIGTDGRVHSPLILKSGGLIGDRNVLQTVRSWRYRPATCNGVPTEIEGKIEFSRR